MENINKTLWLYSGCSLTQKAWCFPLEKSEIHQSIHQVLHYTKSMQSLYKRGYPSCPKYQDYIHYMKTNRTHRPTANIQRNKANFLDYTKNHVDIHIVASCVEKFYMRITPKTSMATIRFSANVSRYFRFFLKKSLGLPPHECRHLWHLDLAMSLQHMQQRTHYVSMHKK